MKNIKNLAVVLLGISIVVSCNKEDKPKPLPINEEEVITTVTTTLTSGSSIITLRSKDLDGDGPNPPVVTVSGNLTNTTGKLAVNTTYTGTVTFLNEVANPASNITEEVLAEGVDHQVFFQPLPTDIGTFIYTDTDANGKPIGLQFNLVTGSAISGNLIVTLRHQPNKSATGVAAGDIVNAAGSTDAEVTYPVVVE